MKLNITKNFIITFFVILAIYQTSELWFEGFSNHNFFYSFFNNQGNLNDDGMLYALDNIIINKGSDRFICIKNNIYKNEYKNIFDNAVKITMQNGGALSETEFDWNEILSSRSVVYRYNVQLDKNSIANMFGFDGELLGGTLENIDTIVIVPHIAANPENIVVGFGNRLSGKGCFYSVEKNQYIYTVYDAIGYISSDKDIYYTSSVKNGLDIFQGNAFIPQWNGGKFNYYPVKAEDPFYDNGEFQKAKLERSTDVFFDNPFSKWTSVSDGVYTYSDENTVVKYYNNGIMEYYNYSTDKNTGGNDFYSKYKNAVSVIKRDSGINNEYYLSGYSLDNEKTVFYFDYKINDFSIKLSDNVKKNTGMNSVIEVTINGGRVAKYRRYARDFYLDTSEKMSVKKGFLKAVEEVFADIQNKNGGQKDSVENTDLVYIMNTDGEAFLSWVIKISGEEYIKEAL